MYDHFEYMRLLAGRVPQIRTYLPSTDWSHLTQLLASLNQVQTPCLVADYDYAAQLVDRGSDNLILRTRYSAMILLAAAPGNGDDALRAQAQARGIADRMLALILRDRAQGLHGLAHLEVPSIRIETLPPVADHALGIGITYTILSALQAP